MDFESDSENSNTNLNKSKSGESGSSSSNNSPRKNKIDKKNKNKVDYSSSSLSSGSDEESSAIKVRKNPKTNLNTNKTGYVSFIKENPNTLNGSTLSDLTQYANLRAESKIKKSTNIGRSNSIQTIKLLPKNIKNNNDFYSHETPYNKNISFSGKSTNLKYIQKNKNKDKPNLNVIKTDKIFKESELAEKNYELIPTEKLENLPFLKNTFPQLFIKDKNVCFRTYEISEQTGGLSLSNYKYGKMSEFIESSTNFLIRLEKLNHEIDE